MTVMTKLRRRRGATTDGEVDEAGGAAAVDANRDIVVPIDGGDGEGEGGVVIPSAAPAAVPIGASRRGWGDRVVRTLLILAIALAAFAGGRFSVHQGPETLAEAMTQFRAGDLPAGEQPAGAGAPGGGFGGMPGGGAPGGGGAGGGAAAGGAPGAAAGAATAARPAG